MSLKFVLFLVSTSSLVGLSLASARSVRESPTKVPLTLADWPSYNVYEPDGPGTYAFGYEIEDPASGNVQFRDEEKLANGTVRGSYGYMRPDGLVSLTRYIADADGYRAETETFKKPTKKPVNMPGQPQMDENILSPEVISPEVAQAILEQHQINIKPGNDLGVDPDVAAIINGVHPLDMTFKDDEKAGSNLVPNSDTVLGTNDKFHNPLIHERKLFRIPMAKLAEPMLADTKEALWYKELIRNRRKEFLKKYSAIPAGYTNLSKN